MEIKSIRLARLAIALVLALGCHATVAGQEYDNTPVSLSKEKVRINGKTFYSHIVLERQTLFSISKAYNVSIDDIYRHNPTLKETGLIKNSIIIIPTEGAPAASVQTEEPADAKPAADNIATAEKAVSVPAPVSAEKEKRFHTVKWFENLNDIAAKYGVEADEIMKANGLTGRKLKSRMKLVIPEPGEYADLQGEEPSEADTEPAKADTTVSRTEEPVVPATKWWEGIRKDKVTASLMLPLKANGMSSSWSNMDFYSGVLLAVNDLALAGTGTDLKVYDINDSRNAISGNDIKGSDIVIGPVSVKDLSSMFAAGASEMIVSPLDPKAESLVREHSNLIQAPTPHKVQYDDLVSWMKEELGAKDKVVLISEKGGRQTEAVTQMKASVDSSGLGYETFSYSILEGRDVLVPLKNLMTAEGTNRVMIASESEAFVNDVVRNLNLLIHQKYPVVLYGASKIRSFDTIEVENFHKTNMHVSLTYYIDYNDQRVKNFLLKYRALFNTEPSQFAYQGYDIASYFIRLCAKYGERWPEMLDKEDMSMLQSTFMYRKDAEGGYTNHGVRRIVYENGWKVTKVR